MMNWQTKGWCNGCQKEVEEVPLPQRTFKIAVYENDGTTFCAMTGMWFCSAGCLGAWAGRFAVVEPCPHCGCELYDRVVLGEDDKPHCPACDGRLGS